MPGQSRILIPLRYPLTAQSTATLEHAGRIAREREGGAQLVVLHVNLLQYNGDVNESEMQRAIEPFLKDVPFSVITRSGFLVEEIILDEARSQGIDTIVVGKNHAPWWRRVISRILYSDSDVTSLLEQRADDDITVEVVDSPV